MMALFECAACGAPGGDLPFRCPAAVAGDNLDHVLVRQPDADWDRKPGFDRREDPANAECGAIRPIDGETDVESGFSRIARSNPFIRYRRRLSFWALGRAHGLQDGDLVEMVTLLDRRVAEVDGRGFLGTPFHAHPSLAAELSPGAPVDLWVKDETNNVSGSHKGRHLMGVMLYLQVAERVGVLSGRSPLAIASCGNAALAAAVVARAACWPLRVFVPPSAHPAVIARLEQHGASITTCQRTAGSAGDPCYHAFRAATAGGALPFCCQGGDNGLTIEGGSTLAWEIVDTLGASALDAVFVQVGGGALASAMVRGFQRACLAGVLERVPRIYAVQTAAGQPLCRAYHLVVAKRSRDATADVMRYARTHRSEFMWPWETEPRSIAHGILDDETYDWAAVVEGMLRTGGRPMAVDEERLERANALARAATGIDVDHTGSAGLAGLMEALAQDRDALDGARVAVIFSGVRR